MAPSKKLIQTVELTAPLVPQEARHLMVTGDDKANTIILHVEENGKPADLTGCNAVAYMIRQDDKRPFANGTVEGNTVTVCLNEGFYVTAARYSLFVRLTHTDGTKCTLLWLNGWANAEGSGDLIDTGEAIPDLDDLLAQIAAMEEATERAIAAASNIENKLDKNLGAENAGKLLFVADDGDVDSVNLGQGLSLSNGTLNSLGGVTSVNGKTGAVTLGAGDIKRQDGTTVEGAFSQLSKKVTDIQEELSNSADDTFKITGNPVVYNSAAEGQALKIGAILTPAQTGSGLPSPDNVRPISVFDHVALNRKEDAKSITTEFGENVAAGTIDVNTGVLTITRGVLVVDGDSPIERQELNDGDDTICIAWKVGFATDTTKRADDICNRLPHTIKIHISNWGSANPQNTKYGESFGFSANGDYGWWLYIRLYKSRFAGSYTVDDVKAWLAENPLTIVYTLPEPRTVQLTPQTITTIRGVNTISSNATTVTLSVVDSPIGILQADARYELKKTVSGLPVLNFTGDITGENKDDTVTLGYAYGNMTGTCTRKWQGSSSLSFDKKNYTVKFGNAFEVVEGWGAQKKYCLKANWIDASHARNVVSAKLWGQVVKSRKTVPERLANLPNAGAVDGFPIIVNLNDEFVGLYTWNIPKDGWMFGMGSGTNEAILCADKHVEATRFKAEAVCDGSDFELEYVTDEDDAAWMTTSVNRMINACINSDGTDLDTTVSQYLDLDSVMDYMIFTSLLRGYDMTDKNYLLSTFDGTKWFFSGYDMDTTYGIHHAGTHYLPACEWSLTLDWFSRHHRAMELVYTYKRAELKARYLELRKGALSDDNVVTTFANFIGLIPANIFRAEQDRWPAIPNSSTSNLHQISDWYCRRAAYIDNEVSKWTV